MSIVTSICITRGPSFLLELRTWDLMSTPTLSMKRWVTCSEAFSPGTWKQARPPSLPMDQAYEWTSIGPCVTFVTIWKAPAMLPQVHETIVISLLSATAVAVMTAAGGVTTKAGDTVVDEVAAVDEEGTSRASLRSPDGIKPKWMQLITSIKLNIPAPSISVSI